MNIFGKIFLLIILGYFYFLLVALISIFDGFCNQDYECTLIDVGMHAGAFWMLISFLFTVAYNLFPNYTFFDRFKILQPYFTIPIFIGLFVLIYFISDM